MHDLTSVVLWRTNFLIQYKWVNFIGATFGQRTRTRTHTHTHSSDQVLGIFSHENEKKKNVISIHRRFVWMSRRKCQYLITFVRNSECGDGNSLKACKSFSHLSHMDSTESLIISIQKKIKITLRPEDNTKILWIQREPPYTSRTAHGWCCARLCVRSS